MGFLDMLSPIIGGASSIVGLIQGNAARAEAQRQQEAALNQMAVANDAQYQNELSNNGRTLYGMAGQGGDAIRALGANMGAGLANAGVYNSSATAGALANAAQTENSAIANLAAQNYYHANQLHDQQQAQLASMRLGQANTQYGYAMNDLNGSRQGLTGFLGNLAQVGLQRANPSPAGNPGADAYTQQQMSLNGITPDQIGTPGTDIYGSSGMGRSVQSAISSSGANAYRTQLPMIPGTTNQGPNLMG